VDRLRAAGRRILGEDPNFRKLLHALHGCLATAAQGC
jgi:hypothetical protein